MSLVTDKQIGKILDARDAGIATLLAEQTDRIAAVENLADQVQNLTVALVGAVKLNNLLQPKVEDVEYRYFIEDNGFRRQTSPDVFQRAKARGQTVYRQVVTLERYEADPDTAAQAQEVVVQIRQEVGR